MNHTDFKWDGDFWTRSVALPFQDGAVELRIQTDGENNPPSSRQIDVANSLHHHLEDLKSKLDLMAAAYCHEIDEDVCLADEEIDIDYDAISKHWSVNCVLIGNLETCNGNYYFLSCDCDWEPEHGMEFLLDGTDVVYCNDHTVAFLAADTDDSYRSFGPDGG